MSDYTKTTDFLVKDGLAAGDPDKLVLGAELDVEFNAIAAALATKSDGNGAVTSGDKGDITVTVNGTVWTIDDAAVSLAKMANLTSQQLIGRKTATTGVPEAFTINDLTADTAPVSDADYVVTWDASATLMKKVLIGNLSIGIPQNPQTGNYTIAATDNGKHIYHAAGAGASDVYTIDSNANLALPIGFAVTFINLATDSISIAITTDTMYWSPTGSTGSRTLAQYGQATAIKVTATDWVISGTGLT